MGEETTPGLLSRDLRAEMPHALSAFNGRPIEAFIVAYTRQYC
jgi:hypothetical protein